MSDIGNARRTAVEVFFAGKDISQSLRDYLISVTYTDNEEDTADDLQIKIDDRDDVWLTKWLNKVIQSAATASSDNLEEDKGVIYKVTSVIGAAVRSRPGYSYYLYGMLAYGTLIESVSTEKGWIKIDYGGKDGYVNASLLTVYTGENDALQVDDEVVVNGRPRLTCFGIVSFSADVVNYKGKISQINKSVIASYPIKIGSLGWFSEAQVKKIKADTDSDRIVDKVSKGLLMQASIIRQNWEGNGLDDHLDCGQFELDSVDCSGPPNVITIKGTSLPFNRTIRQTKKSRSWENYDLEGIAEEMAADSGMTCMFLSSHNPKYERVEQIALSDIKLLQRLCQMAGASLKVTNNIIVIFDQAEYEARPTIRTICRGASGGYTKHKVSSGENDTKYACCRVSYTNPATGEVIEGVAYAEGYDESDEDNQTLEVSEKVNDYLEARELAAKHLRLKNKYQYSASFTFPGDPTLLAGSAVQLQGWGGWDGKYIIKTAKHTVSKSGYTTQITLRQALEDC